MKAVMKVRSGPGNVELRDVPEPEPGPGQVRIAVAAAGVCGTDIHILRDEFPSRPPVILGHEFSGRVDRLGDGVAEFAPGDSVVAMPAAVRCGRCRYCLSGDILMCEGRRSIGHGVDGAFARYVVVPAEMVHRVPQGVPLRHAALAEPVAVAVHAVSERSKVTAGDAVLVSGVGPIGLLILQVVRAHGARAKGARASGDVIPAGMAEAPEGARAPGRTGAARARAARVTGRRLARCQPSPTRPSRPGRGRPRGRAPGRLRG